MAINKIFLNENSFRDYLTTNKENLESLGVESAELELDKHYEISARWTIKFSDNEKIVCLIKDEKNKHFLKNHYLAIDFLAKNINNFRVCRPIWYDEQTGAFFYAFVPGTTFRNSVEDESLAWEDVLAKVSKITEALTSLRQAAPNFVLLNPPDLSAEIFNFKRNISLYDEGLNKEFESLYSGFEFTKDQEKLCHGDFQSGNLVFNEKELTIIDWDNAFLGNEFFDSGTFLAHTDLMVSFHYGDEKAELLVNKFLDSFNKEEVREITKYAAYTYAKVADFKVSGYLNENKEQTSEYQKQRLNSVRSMLQKAVLILKRSGE